MQVLDIKPLATERQSLDSAGLRYGAAWFRITILSGIYITLLLLQVLQGDFLQLAIWQSLNILMFTAFALHLPLIENLASERFSNRIFAIAIGFDLLAISIMMLKIGEPKAVFIFLFLAWIAFAGFTFGVRAGLMAALWGALAMNIVYSLGEGFNTNNLRGFFFLHNIAGFLVGYLGGRLGDEIQFITTDVEVKKDVIKTLSDLNELIVENIPAAILTVDDLGKILQANRGAAKLFSRVSLENNTLSDVSVPIYESFLDYQRSASTVGTHRQELTFYNYRQEKQIFEIVFSQLDVKGQPLRYILLLQNLTEIRNMENAMKQKEKLAAVGQLAAGIAHEIRNPLASISGSVQLLSAGLETQTPEDKKLFNIIIREIDRLNHLITEFLDFVRPNVVVDDPLDLNTLLSELLDMVKNNDSLNKKVEQRRSLQAEKMIKGQADKLKQAILNIVINAYQAMDSTLRPELIIQTFDRSGDVVLIIKDNGLGMSKDNLQRIFEPFHTTKSKGTGLGLAITHKILETHRATIVADSDLGKGTIFEIVFPGTSSPGADDMVIKKYA